MSIHAFRPSRIDGDPTAGHARSIDMRAVSPGAVHGILNQFVEGQYERNGLVIDSPDQTVQTVLLRAGRKRFHHFHLSGRPDVGYDGFRQRDDFQGDNAFFLSADRTVTVFGYDPARKPEALERFHALQMPVLALSLDGLERVIARGQ